MSCLFNTYIDACPNVRVVAGGSPFPVLVSVFGATSNCLTVRTHYTVFLYRLLTVTLCDVYPCSLSFSHSYRERSPSLTRATTSSDRLQLQCRVFWISVALLESDYEHEFLFGLKLLGKVRRHFCIELVLEEVR